MTSYRPARTLAALSAIAVSALIPAAAQARTATVTSFDGTHIHVNFFTAAGLAPGQRAATILVGPGWGSAGDTDPNSAPAPEVGYPGLRALRRAGFNVLTWDPRGFGSSGGRAEVDSPRFEGRDVSALISWLARQRQARLDAPGDPRIGMAGGSYGGGIQLVAAAIDRRIDAIVPDIAWHSLITSLDKANTVKLGWSTLLYFAAVGARLDPMIGASYRAGAAGQPLTSAERRFYASRGPGALVAHIHVPTLLVQGTVDNLFTLQEAVANYRILKAHRVPVKMLWFCGGHGVCLTPAGRTSLIVRETVAWLKRYLNRNPRIDTGPGFQWVDQKGVEHAAPAYPPPAGTPITANGMGRLRLTPFGGSGPALPPAGASALELAAARIAPARAARALNVVLPAPRRTRLVLGAPQLAIVYRSRHASAAATTIYAQLVDDASGKVLGNQITPIRVRLDGRRHVLSLPLEIVAASDAPGEHFTLQLTGASTTYRTQGARGRISFLAIQITLPTVAGT